jgi:Xaa-Pro aminopeptidase
MTVSIGHAVLAVLGVDGFRIEDVARITEGGCKVLTSGGDIPHTPLYIN